MATLKELIVTGFDPDRSEKRNTARQQRAMRRAQKAEPESNIIFRLIHRRGKKDVSGDKPAERIPSFVTNPTPIKRFRTGTGR